MITSRKFVRRLYENHALVAARKVRVLYLFWTRRGRKSTTLGSMAFDAMSAAPHQSVIAASASLLVGAELVSMTLTATEQAIRVRQEAIALRAALASSAAGNDRLQLVTANSETGKTYEDLSDDDYTDLFKTKRLEFRLYFDKTAYSRMMVIAPNPATARGWGGWVFRDEQQFTHPELERELQLATDPIIDTDPSFRLIYASNLCGDDRHPGYEMTLPRDATEFTPDPAGHFYISKTGLMVHRVDLADAYAAGHTLFDKKGEPMPLETALAGMSVSAKKWNYMLVHEAGGTSALDALAFHSAQQRGIGRCVSIYVDKDRDFDNAMRWVAARLVPGLPTGAGFDVATTEKQKSNPSSLTITQRKGIELITVVNVIWKTKDPAVAKYRLQRAAEVCREAGAPLRRLCIDSSNERLFAETMKAELAYLVPVVPIINGENVTPHPSGYEEKAVNYKTYLGDLYAKEVNDNRYTLPPERYFQDDHRAVIKNRGQYECDVARDGGHGDTFDSGKLAQHALDGDELQTALNSETAITMGGHNSFARRPW